MSKISQLPQASSITETDELVVNYKGGGAAETQLAPISLLTSLLGGNGDTDYPRITRAQVRYDSDSTGNVAYGGSSGLLNIVILEISNYSGIIFMSTFGYRQKGFMLNQAQLKKLYQFDFDSSDFKFRNSDGKTPEETFSGVKGGLENADEVHYALQFMLPLRSTCLLISPTQAVITAGQVYGCNSQVLTFDIGGTGSNSITGELRPGGIAIFSCF